METQTIVHAPPARNSLNLELATRALRHSLWLSLYHAQRLQLPGLEHRLTATLVEVDQLLEGLDDRG